MKETTFFCENCHALVHKNDKICKSCGYFFSMVRCPECKYEGDLKDFNNGCPSCGYMPSGMQKQKGNIIQSLVRYFESKIPPKKTLKKQKIPRIKQILYQVGILVVLLGIIIAFEFVSK